MRKTPASPTQGGELITAFAALTTAVQELQAAMKTFAATVQPKSAVEQSASDTAGLQPQDAQIDPARQFDDDTIRLFDIPNAKLHAAIDRARLLHSGLSTLDPLENRRIALDEKERRRLGEYENERQEAGDLSPDEDLKLTEEMERLQTDEARAMAETARGMEDYLPALSANRPAGVTSFAGNYGAARRGNFAFGEGASFAGNYGFAEGTSSAEDHSKHERVFAHAAETRDSAAMERLAEAIGMLSEAILHQGRSGSPLHPGEAHAGIDGLLQTARLPQRPDGYN